MRVLTKFLTFAVNVLLAASLAVGQEPVGTLSGNNSCDYYDVLPQGDVFTFSSDKEALAAIDRVLRTTGLARNFVVRAAAVRNAAAIIQGGERYIVYNQEFMERVKNETHTDWAAISILAHELGHHLQGHTLQAGGSRPNLELEADEYSGFVLENMGASLEQAQIAMNRFASDAGSATHPPKAARLAAIRSGYTRAREVAGEIGKPQPQTTPTSSQNTPAPHPSPAPGPIDPPPGSTTPPKPNQPQFAWQCSFAGDPASYYVTANNQIIGVAPTGQSLIVGMKIPPTVSGFDWMYSTRVITYGVDSGGRVWNRAPNGFTYQVGQCSTTQ